jgi:hypothetical protein
MSLKIGITSKQSYHARRRRFVDWTVTITLPTQRATDADDQSELHDIHQHQIWADCRNGHECAIEGVGVWSVNAAH